MITPPRDSYGFEGTVIEPKLKPCDDSRLCESFQLDHCFHVPGERTDATVLVLIDNSARLAAEARLREIETDFSHVARLSTLGEMTTSIAHEIRQPLAAIMMNAQTSLRYLRKAEPNLEKAEQLMSRIVESAQWASEVIGRIQDMAGKRAPTNALLEFNDIVQQCLIFLSHESEDKNVNIKARLEPNLPPIHGDRIQLQQVIVNLILNSIQAINATPQTRREIYLETSLDENDHVAFSIRDTGTGIPADHMEQIFGGFFTTKEGGLGIGLAICQSIIKAHGGKIAAANHQDGGAIFRFCIPTESAAAAVNNSASSEDPTRQITSIDHACDRPIGRTNNAMAFRISRHSKTFQRNRV